MNPGSKLLERIRRSVPDREALLRSRWLAPFRDRFSHPSLWCFSRRSVVRAVPVGLLLAFIIPIAQIVAGVLLATHIRANVIVVATTTVITNPLTLPFWYVSAWTIGGAILPGATDAGLLAGVSALAIGFIVLGIVAAALGYAGAAWWWRVRLVRRWRNRSQRMEAA